MTVVESFGPCFTCCIPVKGGDIVAIWMNSCDEDLCFTDSFQLKSADGVQAGQVMQWSDGRMLLSSRTPHQDEFAPFA